MISLNYLRRKGWKRIEIRREDIREIRKNLEDTTAEELAKYPIAKRKCLELSYQRVLD